MITPEQMESIKHYIRDNLRKIRKAKGLTPYGFGKQCGLGAQTIRRIEGGRLPIMVTTYKLVDALGLEVGR